MRAAFFTLGCKVNQYETAALERQFAAAGFDIAAPDEEADVYVINSCTVTATGDQKSRQALRRMRRQNPAAVCCLCGCFPQAFPDAAAAIPEADIIMGAKNRAGLLEAVKNRLAGGGRVVDIAPHAQSEPFEDLRADSFLPSRTRAFVKIEDGCRRYCAYCIIPKARGPVRSKPLHELRAELEALAGAGYPEIVLAGVNLSCYGQDLGLKLIDAVRLACGIGGIARVRLSSLEPELLTDDDIDEMGALKKLCPQFHLSLQSGCDETLRRMRRHYDTAEYRRIADRLRGAFPNCGLTTDIMVGFPGETDGEFEESLEFCREMAFSRAHVFAYSVRPGTPAADMPGQIPAAEKRARCKKMIAAMDECRDAFLKEQLNKPARVLFETMTRQNVWEGYSENYTPFLMPSNEDLRGKLLTVVPTAVYGEHCAVE